MPSGVLKRAVVSASPSTVTPPLAPDSPSPAVPAYSVTFEDDSRLIERMALFPVSVTKSFAFVSYARPVGVLNSALVPNPLASAFPGVGRVPSPASVVTTPVREICRITWLPESATKITPPGDTATPVGWLKRAFVPTPSW